MTKLCTYNLDTKFVDGCDPCRTNRYKTKQVIRLGAFNLLVTRVYEYKTCFEGFTHGAFLHALTLLPKEKQEVEIIRRAKYQRALHESRSVESEFEREFSNTMRLELEATQDFNFHEEVGGGFNFFGLFGGSASVSADQSFHFGQNFMAEVITKTSSKVSSKYDISIDTKTEVENQFRSLRTIENPNPCKVVTFFFKQLNKKFKFTLSLISVKYDIVKALPNIHIKNLNHYTRTLDIKKSLEVEPMVATKKRAITEKTINSIEQVVPKTNFKSVNDNIEIRQKSAVLYKELSIEQLTPKMRVLKMNSLSRKRILSEIKRLEKLEDFKPRVIFKSEYCLRTGSVITEPKVSECSICDCDGCDCSCKEEHPEIKNLELEKMKVEIEILKKQLEA